MTTERTLPFQHTHFSLIMEEEAKSLSSFTSTKCFCFMWGKVNANTQIKSVSLPHLCETITSNTQLLRLFSHLCSAFECAGKGTATYSGALLTQKLVSLILSLTLRDLDDLICDGIESVIDSVTNSFESRPIVRIRDAGFMFTLKKLGETTTCKLQCVFGSIEEVKKNECSRSLGRDDLREDQLILLQVR